MAGVTEPLIAIGLKLVEAAVERLLAGKPLASVTLDQILDVDQVNALRREAAKRRAKTARKSPG